MLPEIKDDAHYEALWRDDALWQVAVREVLDTAKIPYAHFERVPGGSNIIYALDEGRIFKLFAPLYVDDARIEEEGLDRVARADLPVLSPEILQRGEHESWRWLLMTRLPGVNPHITGGYAWQPDLDAEARERVILQLADWIVASWNSPEFQAIDLPEKWSDWRITQQRLRDDLVAKHRARGASEHWLAQLEPFFEDWEPLTSTRVVHADLHGRNLLVSQHAGRWALTGVLDFADTLDAPPIYDLAAPVIYMLQGDRALASAFYERVIGKHHGLSARTMMQWILLHRFSNLGFYATTLPHTAGKCDTLDEMAKLMTGLD